MQLFFHGQCFATLHQHVDPACLPSDYDGSMKPMDTMHFSNVFAEKNYSQLFECFDWNLNFIDLISKTDKKVF